jgi:hypothetical protein
MLKKLFGAAVTIGLSFSLMGCFEPSARSMGATLMPAPLQHKADKQDSSSMTVAATGFYGATDDKYNVKDLNAYGGSLDFTYRVGRSPFFVNVGFGGFGGSLKFGCDADYDCSKQYRDDDTEYWLGGARSYREWLETKDGKSEYSFMNFQERVLAGVDFNPAFLILGVAGGLQMFQGNSDYDDKRDELDEALVVDDVDGKSGTGFVMAYWFGFRFGPAGHWGNVVMEYDILHKSSIEDWTTSLKFTYTHPMTGIFAGMGYNDLIEMTLYAGKRFDF